MNAAQLIRARVLLWCLLVVAPFTGRSATWSITVNPQKEIWITPASTGGSGTYADPFKVNSADDFDTLMVQAIAAGVKTFRLTPGTFPTRGYNPSGSWAANCWVLPSNSKFIGSGTTTILQRDTSWQSKTNAQDFYPVILVAVQGSYVTVSDLKIDCNAVATQFNGFSLLGAAAINGVVSGPFNYIDVERVLIEKAMGTTGHESYTIGFSPPNIGSIVSSCVVSNYVVPGDGNLYANAFAAQGNMTFRDCRAYFPASWSHDAYDRVGFNIAGGVNLMIDHCHVENAGMGVYGDSFGMTNLSILNCHFTNVAVGVHLATGSGNPLDGVLAQGNVIDLPSSTVTGGVYYHGFGIWNYQEGARNIKISDNTIRFVQDTCNSTAYAFTFVDTSTTTTIRNATVMNNTVDPSLVPFQTWVAGSNAAQARSSFYILNRTLDGAINPLLNNDPMTPSKYHLITSTSDTIASDDSWVTVRISSNSTFTLPSTGVVGHTLTVYNDQGANAYTVTVNAPSGGSIVASSPTMGALQPNTFQRFIYNGSNTWQRN